MQISKFPNIVLLALLDCIEKKEKDHLNSILNLMQMTLSFVFY